MDKKIIKFNDTKIEEYKSHQYKSPILIKDIDKQGFKYFIGYKDNKEIRPLCIFFPEMGIYKRYSDNTKCMYFMIKDEKVF